MTETPIMIDGKIAFVAPGNVLKAVIVPGTLVNLITHPENAPPHKGRKRFIMTERNGKKTYKTI